MSPMFHMGRFEKFYLCLKVVMDDSISTKSRSDDENLEWSRRILEFNMDGYFDLYSFWNYLALIVILRWYIQKNATLPHNALKSFFGNSYCWYAHHLYMVSYYILYIAPFNYIYYICCREHLWLSLLRMPVLSNGLSNGLMSSTNVGIRFLA